MQRGYIVTRLGVHIGLTAANTQGDFSYVKLAPAPDGRGWAATPACVSVNGATPSGCGSLLMDTGVTAMYLTVPESQAPPEIRTVNGVAPTLVAGTKLTISIPAEDSPRRSTASRSVTSSIHSLRGSSIWLTAPARRSSTPACAFSTGSTISTTLMVVSWPCVGPVMPRRHPARSCRSRRRIDAV